MRQSGKIIKKLLYSLIPIQITSCLGLFLSSLIDTIIVGNLISTDSLAVIGFVVPLTLVFNMIGGVIATGSQILGGFHMGRGESEQVDGAFTGCVLLSVVIGAASSLLCILFSHPLAMLLGARGELAIQTSDYIRGLCTGLLFWLFYKAMLAFLQMDHSPRVALAATITMAVAKVGFDLLFVAVGGLAMFGVGLATSVSYVLAFAIGFVFYLTGKTTIRFRLRTVHLSVIGTILKKGFPNAVLDGCGAIRGFAINQFALYFGGNDAVSVYAFASNAAELFYAGINGTGSATDILNSIFAGTGDRTSLRQVNRHSIRIGTILNLCLWVIVLLVADPIASLSGAEGALLDETALAIRLLFSAALVNVLSTICLHFYRTIGHIVKVNLISFLKMILFQLTPCALLPRLIGTTGIWASYFIGDFLITALLFLYASVKQKGFPRRLTHFIFIPDSVGTPESDQWDGMMTDGAQIGALCAEASGFVRSKGISGPRVAAFSDSLQRLLDNVSAYAGGGRKKVVCDLRVVSDGKTLTLVLRDNGVPFDPTTAVPGEGLTFVRSTAGAMKYQTTLGLNILTVEL